MKTQMSIFFKKNDPNQALVEDLEIFFVVAGLLLQEQQFDSFGDADEEWTDSGLQKGGTAFSSFNFSCSCSAVQVAT